MRKNALVIISGLIVLGLGIGVIFKAGLIKRKNNVAPFFGEVKNFCFGKTCVENEEEIWWVKNESEKSPADQELVVGFIKKLEGVKLEETMAENPVKFSLYGIEDKNKIVLTVREKKLEIGRISNDYGGTYVREENGGAVYLMGTVIDRETMAGFDYWRQKYVTNLPRFQIKKAEMIYPAKKEIKDEKLIDRLAFLAAKKYLGEKEPEGSRAVEYEIETEGEKIKVRAGVGKNKIYWATVGGKYFFEVDRELLIN